MGQPVRSWAGVIGAVGVGVLGAMFLSSPTAFATDDPLPTPSLLDFGPPGFVGDPTTTIESSSIPYLYNFYEQILPYTISDGATVTGAYDTKDTSGVIGLLPLIAFSSDSQVVTDSTGNAPAVGTEWNGIALGSAALPGPAQLAFVDNSMTSPDGTSANIVEFFGQFGNYFSTGPTGTIDELDFFNTWLPIIDTPAATAMSADLADLGGLADLSGISI